MIYVHIRREYFILYHHNLISWHTYEVKTAGVAATMAANYARVLTLMSSRATRRALTSLSLTQVVSSNQLAAVHKEL